MKLTRFAASFLAAVLTFGLVAIAEVPQIISYQGSLTDDSGVPLNATAELTFTLYATDTSTDVIWTETHPVVVITDGLFAVNLGSYTALGSSFTGGERYLAVKIGDEAEITPRIRLASAPFAVTAQRADTAQYAVTAGGTSSGLWTSSGDTVSLSTPTSYVGIGVTSPQEKLHVDGDIQLSTNRDIHFGDSDCEVGTHMGDVHILADDDIRLVPSNQIRISDFGSADWAVISPGLRTVGLGTTEPTEMLHLYSDNDAEGVFAKFESMHPTNWGEVGFRLETPDNRWHLRLDDDSHNNLNAGALGLRSQLGGIEAMTWEADGDVGVGTVHPTERLDVNGNARVRDDLSVDGALTAASLSGDFVGSTIDHTNIVDEVGIASVAYHGVNVISKTPEAVLTRTITVPTAGYVLALGSALAVLDHGISGGTYLYLALTDDPAPWSDTDIYTFAGLNYDVSAGIFYFSGSSQKLFSVPSAGTYTYYMVAERSDDNSASIWHAEMDLLFITTVYAGSGSAANDLDVSEPNSPVNQSAESDQQDDLAIIKAELAALKARVAEFEGVTGDTEN